MTKRKSMNMIPQYEEFKKFLIKKRLTTDTIYTYTVSVRAYFSAFDEVTKENMIAFYNDQLNRMTPQAARTKCVGMNRYCDFIGKPECRVCSDMKAAIYQVYDDKTGELVYEGTMRQLAEKFYITIPGIWCDYHRTKKMLGEYRIEKTDRYEKIRRNQWKVV